ncbi:hypothetical protein SEVIR_9G515850v4 [Setaria viridis]
MTLTHVKNTSKNFTGYTRTVCAHPCGCMRRRREQVGMPYDALQPERRRQKKAWPGGRNGSNQGCTGSRVFSLASLRSPDDAKPGSDSAIRGSGQKTLSRPGAPLLPCVVACCRVESDSCASARLGSTRSTLVCACSPLPSALLSSLGRDADNPAVRPSRSPALPGRPHATAAVVDVFVVARPVHPASRSRHPAEHGCFASLLAHGGHGPRLTQPPGVNGQAPRRHAVSLLAGLVGEGSLAAWTNGDVALLLTDCCAHSLQGD